MRTKSNLLVTLSVSAALALSAMAEEKTTLSSVEITETALEAQIKSITSEKLENQQASDIKDILKSIPSVTVDGNARYGQKVYVRGLEDKSSNISIDGARMSGQLFHHSGDQTIDAEMLKIGSIELGPNSALSGPGVINGAFVYETKDPSDFLEDGERLGGKISTGYQSGFGRKSVSAAMFSRINEYFELVLMGNRVDDKKIKIPNSADEKSKQSKLESGLVKLVVKPNDDNTIKLAYNTYEDGGYRQDRGEFSGTPNDEDNYNEIKRETYTLNYEYHPDSDFINVKAKVYHSDQSLFYGPRSDTNWWTDADRANEPSREFFNKNSGIDIRNSSLLDNHKLTYGLSFDEEEQDMKVYGSRVYTSGAKNGQTEAIADVNGGKAKNYAAYIEDEIELDQLLVTLGARYDIHKLGGVYKGKNKQLSPKFKAEYQASDNLKLRTGYGRIFKGPQLGEALFLYTNIPTQADTKAQTGHNYEVGFDYDLSNTLDADNALFGFTAFTYNIDNYMHPTKNANLSNDTDVEIWGIESILKYKKDNLALSLSHTYSDGEQKNLTSGEKYDPQATKFHTFKLDTDYMYSGNLSFNYNGEYVPGNKIVNDDGNEVSRPGFGVHNLSATYKLPQLKGAKINFGIDNLFNHKYARHTTSDRYYGESESDTAFEVGRNFKVKFSYKF